MREDATPLRPRSLYAITKQAGEATAFRLGESFGVDVAAARLGTCFGPGERQAASRDTSSAPLQILRRAEADVPVLLPRPGRRDWLYIRDAVDGLLALLYAACLPPARLQCGGRPRAVAGGLVRAGRGAPSRFLRASPRRDEPPSTSATPLIAPRWTSLRSWPTRAFARATTSLPRQVTSWDLQKEPRLGQQPRSLPDD